MNTNKGSLMNHHIVLSKAYRQRIRELADSTDGPFYLYDSEKIRENCRSLLNIPYTKKAIHFATMANANPKFLQIVKDMGLNVFVNSILHLETALELGYKGREIIYAASAMDEISMKKVHKSGANLIIDSTMQLDQWFKLFPGTDIGIRCNIGELVVPRKTLAGYFIGKESRLGFKPGEIRKLEGNPHISGLHLYAGTNIIDFKYFINCYKHVAELAELFPSLRFLDFGGGFGLSGPSSEVFDMARFSKSITELMDQVSSTIGRPIQLILEPGRIIGGDAGYFICRIVDIKHNGNHQLIGVNASCVQFPRPLFYSDSAYHPVSIISKNNSAGSKRMLKSTIFGCSTYSRDFLAQDVLLSQPSPGDLIVLGYAGSYCAAAYTKFLGFPQAREYFI
jgi:diaminopimelate decarboxylase